MANEFEDDYDKNYKPSFVLIAIDTDHVMFNKNLDGQSPFQVCLRACYQLLDSLILVKNKKSWSPFAIVLAKQDNEKDTKTPLIDFKQNVLESIKFLKQQSKLPNDELRNAYQRKNDLDLSEFFLYCRKKFKEIQSQYYQRTIIFITNNDKPVIDKQKRFAALNEAKIFKSNDITFQLVTTNDRFDYTLFYNELFSLIDAPPIEELVEDEEGLLEKLQSLIIFVYKRRLKFYPFPGEKRRYITVIRKNYIKKAVLLPNAKIATTGESIKSIQEEGIIDQKYYLTTKNGLIEFDEEEYHEMRDYPLSVGYHFVGITNRLAEIGFLLGYPHIIETDPKDDNGQKLEQFWQYCVDHQKIMLCQSKSRKCAKIRYVEFIPKYANHKRCFLVKNLPFTNDIRANIQKTAGETSTVIPTEKIAVIDKIIETLTFDYHPTMFSNPVYDKYKAYLKAKLLDEPVEDVEETTLDAETLSEELNNLCDEFQSIFDLNVEEKGRKRKQTTTRKSTKKSK